MTSITVPALKRKQIADYCSTNVSPRRFYLHNSIGGSGWDITLTRDRGWVVTAPSEHLIIIRLKYGSSE